jgi:hypothetical protein
MVTEEIAPAGLWAHLLFRLTKRNLFTHALLRSMINGKPG